MDSYTIRRATLDDVAPISALIRRTVRLSNALDYPAEIVELIAANYAPDKFAQRMTERDVLRSASAPGWSPISRRTRSRPAYASCNSPRL